MKPANSSVRCRGSVLGAVLAIGVCSLYVAPAASSGDQEPTPSSTSSASATPAADETPVVDPIASPRPLYVPALVQGVDRSQPPPLTPKARGFVAVLNRSGRAACAPATHVLLVKPEGSSPNTAVAVIYVDESRPDLNLDLYVSDFVVVSGVEDVAPQACREVARRLIAVRELEAISIPPGY